MSKPKPLPMTDQEAALRDAYKAAARERETAMTNLAEFETWVLKRRHDLTVAHEQSKRVYRDAESALRACWNGNGNGGEAKQ